MPVPVGPADFLRLMSKLQVQSGTAADVARLLGYDLVSATQAVPNYSRTMPPPDHDSGRERSKEHVDTGPPAETVEELGEVPAVVAVEPRPISSADEPSWWADTEPLEAEVPGQAWRNPTPAPLFAPERQRDILQALARRMRRGRRVDVMALTGLVARHEPYAELPRLSQASSARSLAIVALRSPFMTTFELDVEELGRQAQALLGREAVTTEWWTELEEQLPRAELVLIIARPGGRTEREVPLSAWFRAVKQARVAGSHVFLLSPETLSKESWRPLRTIEWSRRTRATSLHQRYATAARPTAEGLARLAQLLAPAVRVEPALLRSVRLELLPAHGPELEAQLRMSRYVVTANSLGVTLRADKRSALLAELAPGDLSKRAFELIELAHVAAAPVQQLEERLTRWQQEKPPDWENSIRSALRRATKALSRQRPGLARWVARGASQLPDTLTAHEAFIEAATRAEAVLEQTIPHATVLSAEAAAFLKTLPDAASRGEVEVLMLDPSSVPLRPEELDSPREQRVLARRFGVSPAWLRATLQAPSARSIHGTWIRRELRRELGGSVETPVAVCLDESALSYAQVHSLFEGRKGYDVTFAPARALSEVLEASKIVLLDFDDPNKPLLLRRAAEDPTFLGVLFADRTLAPTESEAVRTLVEVVDARAGQAKVALERLLAFTGQGTGLRVLSRRAATTRARATLPLPSSVIPTLGYSTSTTELTSNERSDAELARTAFTIYSRDGAVANVHILSELWMARLCRAIAVLHSADGAARTACWVEGTYAVMRAGGAEPPSELKVGEQLVQRLDSNRAVLRLSVTAIAGELAIAHANYGQVNSTLPLEDDPPVSGLAVAAFLPDADGLPEVYWGLAQSEEDGSSRLVIQRPSLNGVSPNLLLGGLAVMIEGRYAGHATDLAQAADGTWSARISRAPKHLLATPTERSARDEGPASSSPWAPPPPPNGNALSQAIDPRVARDHRAGQLPTPRNPPPPVGWTVLQGSVTHAQQELATRIVNDGETFAMGSFVQAIIDGRLIGARVQWSELHGATGRRGSFRGVTLFAPEYIPASGSLELGSEGRAVQRWQEFLKRQGYSSVVADGRFGKDTAARTRDFQKTQKLVADGIVGNATYRAARQLGFDPNADQAAPDGLVRWVVALSGVATEEIGRRVAREVQSLTESTLPKPAETQGSRLLFQTTRQALDALLRRRRAGLSELAGLPIVWLAEEQREPDEMDPQRGRFGSLPERNGRRLTARIQRDGKRYLVALTVSAVGNAPALTGAVVFHLHPTFKQALYRVSVESGRAPLELDVWGWFTVGVECDDGTRLEIDLGDLPRPHAGG